MNLNKKWKKNYNNKNQKNKNYKNKNYYNNHYNNRKHPKNKHHIKISKSSSSFGPAPVALEGYEEKQRSNSLNRDRVINIYKLLKI